MAVAATCCASARAQDSVAIVPTTGIPASGEDSITTLFSELPAPDVTNQTYSNIISTDGGDPGTATVPSGYSLPLLLSSLAPGASFTFAEINLPDGRSLLLTHAQATSETAFPGGPAVVWDDSQGPHFLMPSTGTGIADAGETTIGMHGDQPLAVYLHSGSILMVNVTASMQKLAVNKPVRFTATVSGASPGTTLSYRWSFGDGTGSTKQTPVSHSYLVAGTYDVYLRATGSDDSLGFSSLIPITVGETPKGPDRQGGGKSKKKTAPTNGAGVRGNGQKKSTTTKRTASGGVTAATNPAHATTTATTKPASKAATSRLSPSQSHHGALRRVLRSAGPLLCGIPLDAIPEPARRPNPPTTTRPGAQNPARTGHLTPPDGDPGEAFWIVLGALASLLAGGLLERNGPPRIVKSTTVIIEPR